ncbi:preprotein translocase subunit SecF [Anaplasma centrale str. Israel]|uniref:Protein-export membrane protein SecF n=1 Tax=Anaplasma centrale (strain Israel) TaxID=574556 RepID=D1ATK1_ANACI|nr:protein translocase subunit SecF [Anaplasma centrale]ACZ48879.1 preprotein translocase subunit SecF [Anaplasma centrale str. Israel]
MVLRIIPDSINFDFVRHGKLALFASFVLLLSSVLIIVLKGVTLGTDFTGGVVADFRLNEGHTSVERVRAVLSDSGLSGLSVQGVGDDGQEFMVIFRGAIGPNGSDELQRIKSALNSMGAITYRRLDYVGAQVGGAQVVRGIVAVLCSLVGMFLYLCCRFRWQFAVGGVLALVHDVVITMGIVSATGIEFGLPATAGILMIIGYSVNDSVVIYDRIRELISGNGLCGKSMGSIINAGINSTLSRTLLTSGTTLLAAVPLVLLCEGAVRDLGIIAFCGVVIGTYSSIFISTIPLMGGDTGALKRKNEENPA